MDSALEALGRCLSLDRMAESELWETMLNQMVEGICWAVLLGKEVMLVPMSATLARMEAKFLWVLAEKPVVRAV